MYLDVVMHVLAFNSHTPHLLLDTWSRSVQKLVAQTHLAICIPRNIPYKHVYMQTKFRGLLRRKAVRLS